MGKRTKSRGTIASITVPSIVIFEQKSKQNEFFFFLIQSNGSGSGVHAIIAPTATALLRGVSREKSSRATKFHDKLNKIWFQSWILIRAVVYVAVAAVRHFIASTLPLARKPNWEHHSQMKCFVLYSQLIDEISVSKKTKIFVQVINLLILFYCWWFAIAIHCICSVSM